MLFFSNIVFITYFAISMIRFFSKQTASTQTSVSLNFKIVVGGVRGLERPTRDQGEGYIPTEPTFLLTSEKRWTCRFLLNLDTYSCLCTMSSKLQFSLMSIV